MIYDNVWRYVFLQNLGQDLLMWRQRNRNKTDNVGRLYKKLEPVLKTFSCYFINLHILQLQFLIIHGTDVVNM